MVMMMKRIRIILCTLLSLLMLLAAGTDVCAHYGEATENADTYTQQELEFMRKLYEVISRHGSDVICASDYGIDINRLNDLYTVLYCSSPEFFYVSAVSGLYTYSGKDLYFKPKYICDEKKTEQMQKEIDIRVENILAGIDDRMCDAEKILYIHDAVVGMCDYVDSDTDKGRNIYDVFVKGKALCVGYTLAFSYLCDKIGIPNIPVFSDDHIWNMVELDGKWYYVDCTWDELLENQPNCVLHLLILVSDDFMKGYTTSHGKYHVDYDADSDKYEDAVWTSVISRMDYYDGKWYFIADGGLYRYSFRDDRLELLEEINEKWRDVTRKVLGVSFGKTAVWNDKIIYSSKYAICSYDPRTGKKQKLYSADPSKGMICDFVVKNNKVNVYISKDVTKLKGATVSFSLKKDATGKNKAGLQAVTKGNYISLSWDEIPKAEQYAVYRYDKKTKRASKICTTSGTKITFKRTSADEGCLYSIKVKTAEGLSDYCGWIAA